MSYIENSLMQDEEILHQTKPHWVIFLPFVAWIIVAFVIYTVGSHYQIGRFSLGTSISLHTIFFLIFLFIALINGLSCLITHSTSEYGVTNKRVLMKVGLIRRLTIDILVNKIESIKVSQTILGRFLNYGSISISGIGGSKDPFHKIPAPFIFRRTVQEQLEK